MPNVLPPTLGLEASAALRDRLLAELDDLANGDDAARWAHRCLPEKNKLTPDHARRVEEAFQAKLATFAAEATCESPNAGGTEEIAKPREPAPSRPNKRSRLRTIDKSVLTLPEPRRLRDRDHVRYVAKQLCLICARQPCDAHHLRFTQSQALGRKVSDEFTVPLCRGHHREVHRCGDEAAWWTNARIDPTAMARTLWLQTHPLLAASSDSLHALVESSDHNFRGRGNPWP